MVTHDAAAAAIADRILFLADGLIVDELARSEPAEILAAMNRIGSVIKVALKGLLGRKLRALLTAFAIVLGVAMVSGTYVLTDTIKNGFDSDLHGLVPERRRGRSAARPRSAARAQVDRAVVPGVAARQGQGAARRRRTPSAGSPTTRRTSSAATARSISTGGAPNLGFSVNPPRPALQPARRSSEGRWPVGPDEIAIDAGDGAASKHYTVGETIGVSVHGPTQPFRIVGIAELGGVASIGGATLAIFDLPTAQRLFQKVGPARPDPRLEEAAAQSTPKLARRDPLDPAADSAGADRRGSRRRQDASDTTSFLSFLQKFLLAFGFVALFVGAFVIVNTLSITIAQRTRELATLRTIGATAEPGARLGARSSRS